MKLHFTKDWLRDHILNGPDDDSDAGLPLRDGDLLKRFVSGEPAPTGGETAPVGLSAKPAALQILLLKLRQRDGLSIAQFAERLRVDGAELEALETDPSFAPRPRTVHQLASYLKVPAAAVQRLTPDAAQGDVVTQAALKFAASSDDLSALTRKQRQGLNDFVKVLSNYKGK